MGSLSRLADLLHGRWRPDRARPLARREAETGALPDFADVRGQADAKRALEIAAAGGHNVLMVGPPGAGKTMVARRLPGILPPPSFDEALEITRIHSAAGSGRRRPGRGAPLPRAAPHHLRPRGSSAGARCPSRGDHPRAPRRVVPGRGRGVLPRDPRGAAPAAGGRVRRDHPKPALPDVSHPHDADGGVQSVSVREPARRVPVHARWIAIRYSAAPQRTAAGPDRPRLSGATRRPRPSWCPRGRGGSVGSIAGRVVAARERQRQASGRERRALQRRDGRSAYPPPGACSEAVRWSGCWARAGRAASPGAATTGCCGWRARSPIWPAVSGSRTMTGRGARLPAGHAHRGGGMSARRCDACLRRGDPRGAPGRLIAAVLTAFAPAGPGPPRPR